MRYPATERLRRKVESARRKLRKLGAGQEITDIDNILRDVYSGIIDAVRSDRSYNSIHRTD